MRSFWIAAMLALPVAAAAHKKDHAVPEQEAAAEGVEEIEDVEVSEPEPTALDFPTLLGRLHPSLVHFPLGWLFLALLFDLATFAGKREHLARAGLWSVMAAALAFVPAMITGLVLLSGEDDGEEIAAIVRHRNVMFAALGVLVAALALRLTRKNQLTGNVRWIYLGLMVIAALVVATGGHLGGEVVHGQDFLPW